MGYDPKATLIKKQYKTMANGDKLFLKLMKQAIEQGNRQSNYRRQKSGDDKQITQRRLQTVTRL